MTLQNLCKILDKYQSQLGRGNIQQFEQLKGLPFYNWQDPQDTRTLNHAIGLRQKNGLSYPLFDYEEMLYNVLQMRKHIWIKKSTGLGLSEFF